MADQNLFGATVQLPDIDANERLSRLVGMDDKIARLSKMLGVLVDPNALQAWAQRHHAGAGGVVQLVGRRPPLVVLAGDVGSGKTELAETIGDRVAREQRISITLFPLSLSTRGQGRVGEMTQLLTEAFDHVAAFSERLKNPGGKARGAALFLVDEADALAQSRETDQMHHEDRAGVNAFIRGIDKFANNALPAAVIMCTNRLGALDPAVRRRSADVIEFSRPNPEQRAAVLSPYLQQLGVSQEGVRQIVSATGPSQAREVGFTYSDLTQRLLPTIVLEAFPNHPVSEQRAIEIARNLAATPPFKAS
ncbi:AAA family ATPase [Maricaulis sp.]|uniref:AAA family ATPase n=1 Tax=Maricaulis sp. TaxID=1486257 RepID=UPI00262D2262|nr:AAA family ATPase [Maricaulis sp.]